MWALVTGASSGIGRNMARYLYTLGYNLILVARNESGLLELKKDLENSSKKIAQITEKKNFAVTNQEENKTEANQNIKAIKKEILVIPEDLSKKENCYDLYQKTKNIKLDILINNAGFGEFGKFINSNLEKEIDLINTNITAVHILTKLYLQNMVKENGGHILNVASIAGMEPGPLMSAYYASKAYVIRLSRAINKELKKDKSNVKVSVLCPGPTNTNFNNVANVVFKAPAMSSEKVAKYGVDKALRGKLIIVPGFTNKCVRLFSKILPDAILEECAYHIQRKKF